MTLTDRQAHCLAIIESSIRVHGRSPTFLEIAETMCISQKAVAGHLTALERKQVICWRAGEVHVIKPSSVALAAIRFASSDRDWVGDVTIVCAKNGFSGRIEQLPAWLDERLQGKN